MPSSTWVYISGRRAIQVESTTRMASMLRRAAADFRQTVLIAREDAQGGIHVHKPNMSMVTIQRQRRDVMKGASIEGLAKSCGALACRPAGLRQGNKTMAAQSD
jgi:hypothetical protein